MILLTCLYLQLVSSYRYVTAAESGSKCSSSDPDLFNSQFQDYLVGYNLLRGPGSVSGWPLFQTPHKGRSNATNGCRSAKLKNRRGGLVDVRIPPYVDQLESYPEPTIFDTGLATHNSTWRAYVDWRRRRCGLAAPVTNESKYEELYSVLEYPFRFGSGALAYKQEFRRLLENENRFFRIFTVVVSGAMTIRPRSLDQLDPRFVEYLKAALDGGEKLEPVNRLPWRNDNSRWVPEDEKAQNWYVIFSDAYGTHYPTGIKFGFIFDLWLNRSTCRQQANARLSELAQCYFAESKINLTITNPVAFSATSKDGLVSVANTPNNVEICPHLKQASRDLRAYITHPSGSLEPLPLDSRHTLADYMKRIPEEARRFWYPTLVEARMSPICELIPLVKPNDLDAKVACEKNLLKYMRSIEPVDDRKPSAALCDRDERRLVTEEGAVCISARLSDLSCPNGSAMIRIDTRVIILGMLWLTWKALP